MARILCLVTAACLTCGLFAQETTAEKKFFVQFGLGIGIFPGSTDVTQTFQVYGESGSLLQTYGSKQGLSGALIVGKYLNLAGKKIKAGLCLNYTSMKSKDDFLATVPHPFIANNPRNLSFSDSRTSSIFGAYIFGLYPIIGGETFRVYLGPAIGMAAVKFNSLEDFELEDKAPFAASDLSVSSKTFATETVSAPTFGALLNAEYYLSESLALVADAGFHAFSPKSKKLNETIKHHRVQMTIGVAWKF